MHRQSIFLILPLIIMLHLDAFSQDPYRYRERGNRNEGRKAIGVNAPDLELLSFISYREKVDLSSNKTLKLKFYMLEDAKVFITARELIRKEFYFMNPLRETWQQGWQEFNLWSTSEVIKPLGISPEKLGVVGRLYDNNIGSGTYVPLIFYCTELPTHVDKYIFHFITSQDLSDIKWKIYEANSKIHVLQDSLQNIFSSEAFSIAIDLSKVPSGNYKLIVDCKYKNRLGGPYRTYYFYHKAEVMN